MVEPGEEGEQKTIRRNTTWNTGLTIAFPLLFVVPVAAFYLPSDLETALDVALYQAVMFGVPAAMGCVVVYFFYRDVHPGAFLAYSVCAGGTFGLFWGFVVFANFLSKAYP